MTPFSDFLDHAAQTRLAPWCERLAAVLKEQWTPDNHGDYARWQAALNSLPDLKASQIMLDQPTVTVGAESDCSLEQQQQIESALMGLHPWRKGPFDVFGVHVDTEWRSDWKWQRVAPHLQSLQGRSILDIGCGSGYHLWRMLGAGADMVVGIDPSLLFYLQFQALQHFIQARGVYHLPLGIEHLPAEMKCFDTVFSMGVLYHRRSPFDHLIELRDLLRPGGELVLETLVIEGEAGQVLVPDGRYARMGNVWFLPTVATLIQWMQKVRFKQVRCVDLCATTTQEQRPTRWMTFQSLQDFLDPDDPGKTIEGYPAPLRATFIAQL